MSPNHSPFNELDYLPEPRAVKLLLDIGKTGSINRSAARLGLSYATAWRCLQRVEEILGLRLLASKKGGRRGGGTALTLEGEAYVRALVAQYPSLQQDDAPR